MKANTTKQYPYLGDYYGYTVVTSADGTVTENVYATVPTQVTLELSVNLLGDLVIESQSKMQLNGYIKNIVDANTFKLVYDGLIEGLSGLTPGTVYFLSKCVDYN